jgi:Domain of unknown function (DUF397)
VNVWRKSSTCEAGTCVEVNFVKSTRSGTNGACVEVASCTCGVKVRDSKDPDGPVLGFTHAEWDAFVTGAKKGEFDLPSRP